jgi:uncharacterized protein
MSYPEVELVNFIVSNLVDDPDCYTIDRAVDEKGVFLQLNIDRAHAGRVIGKGGNGAQAIRTLLRPLGAKNNARYSLKIVERD